MNPEPLTRPYYPDHSPDHRTILQPGVALESDPCQPLSWASLAPPEAASLMHCGEFSYVAILPG